MKEVLITGENSFIGMNVSESLKRQGFSADTISVRSIDWKTMDFSSYDVVFHVAGIAHVSYQTKDKEIYDEINHKLTKEVAEKAKKEGVSQFIFMSSMIVYDHVHKKITKETPLDGKGAYALSKIHAEEALKELSSDAFKVVILRPSMVYGKGHKANFSKLVKLAKISPIFPRFYNQHSFLYVGHLSVAIYEIIKNNHHGIFHLADEAISTTELIQVVKKHYGQRLILIPLLNPLVKVMMKLSRTFSKMYGTYYYDESLTHQSFEYRPYSLKERLDQALDEHHE